MNESWIIGTLSKALLIQDAFHYSVTVRRKGGKHSVRVKFVVPRFERAALKNAAEDEGFTLGEALTQRVRQAVETGYLNFSPPSVEPTPLPLDTGQIGGIISDLRARRRPKLGTKPLPRLRAR